MHPGDIVAGKYRVANILGRTNGYLLEARHTEFEQRVVIRLLSPHLCDKKEIERFRREARTLSKLESEHVARIIDVGTHSDGSFYLVRQHLEGIDLATHLRNQGALPLDDAVLFILQAGEAVQECHSHNILLREVQPAHLFLTRRRGGAPMIKITDFGTAKLLRDPAEIVNGEATATVMFGMTAYSSPELVRKNKVVDARTDVWSLGCIFYEMLAAVPPFHGDAAELMLRITREDPIPLSQLRPDVPRELDQIMAWALAKDPTSRFSSVYAMAHALKPHASPEGQVLIDRIGRLAHTQPGDPPPPQISPTSPLSRRSSPSSRPPPPSRRPEQTMLMPDPSYDESEYERTRHFGDEAFPAPPSSYPRSQPPVSSRGSVPPPPASHPGGSGSWSALAIDPDPLGSPYSSAASTGGWPAPTALGQQQRTRQRKAAVIAFGASLLLLPALVMVLVVTLRGQGMPGIASNEADAKQGADSAPAKGSDDTSSSAPAASEAATSAPAASTSPEPAATAVASSPAFPPPAAARATPPDPRTTKAQVKPPPPPPPEEEIESPGGGETGTLVAIAIGGSCAFAVDGAPHGTRSSIRVTVAVGPHTVSCSPKGKASRSQRVNVKPGKPGMATFRLN